MSRQRVVVTGATGLVGRRLVEALVARGDQVTAVSRSPEAAKRSLPEGIAVTDYEWHDALAQATAVVHLAGENIFDKRWTAAQKDRLWTSRVDSATRLAQDIAALPKPPVLISGSAVGYYGMERDQPLDESAGPGVDFLARLCAAWEKAVDPSRAVTRVVTVRTGIVLDDRGGALVTMARPFRMGVGGPVASGKQGVSWVHHADMTALLLKVLDDPSLSGPVNATAPNPVANAFFSKALAHRLHRPCLFPVPKLALRAVFGEVAEVLAGGQYVVPRRIQDAGFTFRFPKVEAALADLPIA